mgnify:CR=1 FL=1
MAREYAGENQIMSNWLSEYSGDEQQQVDQVNAKGVVGKSTQQTEPSLFEGAGLSIPKGVIGRAHV